MKFSDIFEELDVPYAMDVAAVEDFTGQYGPQKVVHVKSGDNQTRWYIDQETFPKRFPGGLYAGAKIEVTKSQSPKNPERTFYDAVVLSQGDVTAGATSPPAYTGGYSVEKDFKLGLAGVYQARLASGMSTEDARKEAVADVHWIRETAKEMADAESEPDESLDV